jgi:hypothetical protein
VRVAYPGDNPNKVRIDKAVFEAALPTLAACRVEARYDPATHTLGGHDLAIIETDAGLRLVRLTHPVGMVPQGAACWWETLEDAEGVVHEYLCVGVAVWRETDAFTKLRDEGTVGQSMEVRVVSSHHDEKTFVVDKMEFICLQLLGEDNPPCFPQASLTLVDTWDKVLAAPETPTTAAFAAKGEITVTLTEVLEEFNVTAETLGFSLDGMTPEALRARLQREQTFALHSTVQESLRRALDTRDERTDRWSYLVDYDRDAGEMYYRIHPGDVLMGASFTFDGATATVDFANAKPKTVTYADFPAPAAAPAPVFTETTPAACEPPAAPDTPDAAPIGAPDVQEFAALRTEVENLRQFKADTLAAQRTAALQALFARFADLESDAQFVALRTAALQPDSTCSLSVGELEEKCFALRGRLASQPQTFTAAPAPVVALPLDVGGQARTPENDPAEPYGGLIARYKQQARAGARPE